MRDWIRFCHVARRISYHEATGKFTVIVPDLRADREIIEEFDWVVVASGHLSVPNVPEFPGFDTFNGRILQAHDFRDAREVTGKDIVIVGTSYSAEGIGSQCWKYGVKSITVANGTAHMGFKWPDNWKEVPILETVEGNTATFRDGSTQRVDAIILCTGYKHHFSFLPNDLRLRTKNRLPTANRYKGVVWVRNPILFYLGMQDQWCTFNMFDAQGPGTDPVRATSLEPSKAVRSLPGWSSAARFATSSVVLGNPLSGDAVCAVSALAPERRGSAARARHRDRPRDGALTAPAPPSPIGGRSARPQLAHLSPAEMGPHPLDCSQLQPLDATGALPKDPAERSAWDAQPCRSGRLWA